MGHEPTVNELRRLLAAIVQLVDDPAFQLSKHPVDLNKDYGPVAVLYVNSALMADVRQALAGPGPGDARDVTQPA